MSFAGPTSSTVNTMIRIAGIGDHNQPDWLITINVIAHLGITVRRYDAA
jgi:hypothetical protein